MNILELLGIARSSTAVVEGIINLVERLQREERDPTPAEIAVIKARQLEVESRWAALLPPKPPEETAE